MHFLEVSQRLPLNIYLHLMPRFTNSEFSNPSSNRNLSFQYLCFSPEEDPDENYLCHTSACLCLHQEWLCRVHSTGPGSAWNMC